MIILIQTTVDPEEYLRLTHVPEYKAREIRNEITKANASFAHFTYGGKEYSFNRAHVAHVAISPEEV